MTIYSSDLYSFERVTITKIKFGHYVVSIDGQPIQPEEIRARLSLFMRNDDKDPLNIELVKVLLRHKQKLNDCNFNRWLTELGLFHSPIGDNQDINGQYLCFYLSDFLKIDNLDIAILLEWITDSGLDYERKIKHRKKAFYDNLSQRYASKIEAISVHSFSDSSIEPSAHVRSLIKRELFTDVMGGVLFTQNLVEQHIRAAQHTEEKVVTRVKNARKKEKQETISEFIHNVLHQIENNLI